LVRRSSPTLPLIDDRGDVVNEYSSGVATIHDRLSFNVAVFIAPLLRTRAAREPVLKLRAAKAAGLSPGLPAGSAAVMTAEFRAGSTATPDY